MHVITSVDPITGTDRRVRTRPVGTTMTNCPECGAEVAIPATVETGEIIDCGTCNAELEVIDLNPPVIDVAPELEEDWGE